MMAPQIQDGIRLGRKCFANKLGLPFLPLGQLGWRGIVITILSVCLSMDLVRAISPQTLAAGSSNFAGMFLMGSSCATSWCDVSVTSDLHTVTFDLNIHFHLDTVNFVRRRGVFSNTLFF